ncbi:MAG TPA: ATP-binding protein, partial [Blastocatellia bacterium]
ESEINLYRVVQESINNIVKHSAATQATVSIERDDQAIRVMVQDNGKGFLVEQNATSEPGRSGFGLIGLSERVRILGGSFNIKSTPGQGTVVSATIPQSDSRRGERGASE